MLEFRWIAAIALWTLLAGPMFDSRLGSGTESKPPVRSGTVKTMRAR